MIPMGLYMGIEEIQSICKNDILVLFLTMSARASPKIFLFLEEPVICNFYYYQELKFLDCQEAN